MPPIPSHRTHSFTANRTFVDRDASRHLFYDACTETPQRDTYRVLSYFGIGGHGKTALCGELLKHIEAQPNNNEQQIAWAQISFEDVTQRNLVNALLTIRMALSETGKLCFPAFDTAFARYFSLSQAGRDLEQHHPELFKQPHDLLQGVSAVAEGVSGIPLLGKAVDALHNLDQKRILKHWMDEHGNALLGDLTQLKQHELEEKLVTFLGADIDDWLHNTMNAPPRRLVLLFDTYEALWQDRPNKSDPLADQWVRRLVADTPGVLHVMLGREALQWHELEPNDGWNACIRFQSLEELEDSDAEAFLNAVPIPETAIREKIISGAAGIPFYLHLQVDQYEQDQRRNLTPQVEQFGGSQPEMLARFVSHLPDGLERALSLAAYPRWLDENLFLKLCEQVLGGIAVVRFADLTQFSFWTAQDGRYYLHAVMRDYLLEDAAAKEPEVFKQVHTFLHEHYDAPLQALESARDITDVHTVAFTEGAYHLEQTHPAKLAKWVASNFEPFYSAAHWNNLQKLLVNTLEISRQAQDTSGTGITLHNIARIQHSLSNYENALFFYNLALNNAKITNNSLGVSAILNNISQVHHIRGDIELASKLLQEALFITKQINNAKGESDVLNNLSQLSYDAGDYDISLHYLEKALKIKQMIGDRKGQGEVLNNISQILKQHGKTEAALQNLDQALKIQTEIGDTLGGNSTLNNIAAIFTEIRHYDHALRCYEQLFNLQKLTGDKKGLGTTLNNISMVHYAKGEDNLAITALEKSLILRKKIGDSLGICNTHLNCGTLQWEDRHYRPAIMHWLKAYSFAKKCGFEQPLQTLESIRNKYLKKTSTWEALANYMEENPNGDLESFLKQA